MLTYRKKEMRSSLGAGCLELDIKKSGSDRLGTYKLECLSFEIKETSQGHEPILFQLVNNDKA